MRVPGFASTAAACLLTLLLTGCSTGGGFFSNGDDVEVIEVRRLTVCNSVAGVSRLSLLPDIAAVRAWQAERNVDLFGDGNAGPALPPGPFAMVEHGARATGGYGLVVSRRAIASGNDLALYATYLSPGENQMRSQMVTSPCVLVALPAGSHYDHLSLLDQTGAIRARVPDDASPAAAAATVPAQ